MKRYFSHADIYTLIIVLHRLKYLKRRLDETDSPEALPFGICSAALDKPVPGENFSGQLEVIRLTNALHRISRDKDIEWKTCNYIDRLCVWDIGSPRYRVLKLAIAAIQYEVHCCRPFKSFSANLLKQIIQILRVASTEWPEFGQHQFDGPSIYQKGLCHLIKESILNDDMKNDIVRLDHEMGNLQHLPMTIRHVAKLYDLNDYEFYISPPGIYDVKREALLKATLATVHRELTHKTKKEFDDAIAGQASQSS